MQNILRYDVSGFVILACNFYDIHGYQRTSFRQEDAQEFLSFVMDQMHDELLKLEGQSSSLNGSKSFLVSSVEDDEWETVGPKNKSAVTRTQRFIPSELNDIFGGQLQSLVKAKGTRYTFYIVCLVKEFILSLHVIYTSR
jgi:ubiquitin C-terminal hydrolase